MNSSFLYHAWAYIALNVQERNTKVMQLLFMCKAKSLKRLVSSAECAIGSRTDTVQVLI